MGQVLSYIWRCLRPKPQSETRLTHQYDQLNQLINPLQQQSHYINIPDVSGLDLDTVAATPSDFTPQVPCIVVDLSNVDRKDDKKDEETSGDKEIRVVENTILHKEKEVVSKVNDELKETSTNLTGLPSGTLNIIGIKRIGPYTSEQTILLVGEGDFSFSACLARAFGNARNITATSLNSEEFLIENYSEYWTNMTAVVTRGGNIIHGIDARTMAKDPAINIPVLDFDRIIFNFPHAGRFGRTDSDLRKHKELVRGFFRNAKKMISGDGEIHVTHKSSGFFLQWDIPKIGRDHGLILLEEVKFKRSKYPGYHTKYGFGGDKDFECNPSKTYKFGRLG